VHFVIQQCLKIQKSQHCLLSFGDETAEMAKGQ